MSHLNRLAIYLNLEMKISELMKRNPLKVSPDESLAEVSKKMASLGKDVVVKNLLEQLPPDIRDMKISELMKAPMAKEFMESCGLLSTDMCVVINEDEIVVNAIRVMAISGMNHILVVGEKGVVGTLSDIDLLKAFK
jgi:CBS domain-containing protein